MAGSEVAPVALRKAASLPGADGATGLPESSWYSVKRRLLGPPLVDQQLRVERLSKPLGLGVLSCDGIGVAREAFGGACRMSFGKPGRCRSGTTPAACPPSRPCEPPGDDSPDAVAPCFQQRAAQQRWMPPWASNQGFWVIPFGRCRR